MFEQMKEQQSQLAEKTVARLQLSPRSRHELLLYNLTHDAKPKVDDYWTDVNYRAYNNRSSIAAQHQVVDHIHKNKMLCRRSVNLTQLSNSRNSDFDDSAFVQDNRPNFARNRPKSINTFSKFNDNIFRSSKKPNMSRLDQHSFALDNFSISKAGFQNETALSYKNEIDENHTILSPNNLDQLTTQ